MRTRLLFVIIIVTANNADTLAAGGHEGKEGKLPAPTAGSGSPLHPVNSTSTTFTPTPLRNKKIQSQLSQNVTVLPTNFTITSAPNATFTSPKTPSPETPTVTTLSSKSTLAPTSTPSTIVSSPKTSSSQTPTVTTLSNKSTLAPTSTMTTTSSTMTTPFTTTSSHESGTSQPQTTVTIPSTIISSPSSKNASQSTTASLPTPSTNVTANSQKPDATPPASAPISTTETPLLNETVVVYSWIFFCHGVTTPIQPYPKDPYSPTFWQFQLQWLTKEGQRQMYELGKWIRKRYPAFCKSYQPHTVEMLSENSDYTFMSAETVLAGLFPPNGTEQNETSIEKLTRTWQPIPVHGVEPLLELLGSSPVSTCRQYDFELDSVTGNSPWSDLLQNYSSTIDHVIKNSGYNFTDSRLTQILRTMYQLYYDLQTEERYGLPLALWTKKIYPEPLQSLAVDYLQLYTNTSTLQRLQAGPTIDMVVNSMKQKIKGTLEENLKLFSGDQRSLTSIMNSFGVFNQLVPPFGSAFLLELSTWKNQSFVTMYLKNSTASSAYTLTMSGCDTLCPFDQFDTLTRNTIPSNWSEECEVMPISGLTLSTPLLIAGLVVIIVLVFLALLLLVKCCRCCNRKKSRISSY